MLRILDEVKEKRVNPTRLSFFFVYKNLGMFYDTGVFTYLHPLLWDGLRSLLI